MLLADIRAEKKALEDLIVNKLTEFQKKTGLHVDDVKMRSTYGGKHSILLGMTITINCRL